MGGGPLRLCALYDWVVFEVLGDGDSDELGFGARFARIDEFRHDLANAFLSARRCLVSQDLCCSKIAELIEACVWRLAGLM
ncbi:Uncharacterised protein [Mycobacteroides abscessus]|nr:Uncharacterised protein [Mycobacteroides abscessus]